MKSYIKPQLSVIELHSREEIAARIKPGSIKVETAGDAVKTSFDLSLFSSDSLDAIFLDEDVIVE